MPMVSIPPMHNSIHYICYIFNVFIIILFLVFLIQTMISTIYFKLAETFSI